MNEGRQFRDGQHRQMWMRIRTMRRAAAKRGNFRFADLLEVMELVASGERIEKVTNALEGLASARTF